MKSHAGLTKKTITAKGKKGPVKRSYWVRTKEYVKANKGKVAVGAVALAGAAALGVKHRGVIARAAKTVASVRHVPAAHAAGVDRGVKFRKAAQQAQWDPARVKAHERKGYAQGFRNRMQG